MVEFFIAFRSRTDAVKYHEMLMTYRLPSKLINTPSSVGIGCGLSVKLFSKDMQLAMTVLERGRFTSAVGAYYISQNGGIGR
ncbi:MAG: DUF3343 domain-containing protein, partial [Clostridia bacterium]